MSRLARPSPGEGVRPSRLEVRRGSGRLRAARLVIAATGLQRRSRALVPGPGAEPRENQLINPAPGFWPIFGPLGPTAGPGSPGKGPGSKNSAGCTTNQPRRRIPSPIRGHFVFLGRPQKDKNINDKFEAPQGLPRSDELFEF